MKSFLSSVSRRFPIVTFAGVGFLSTSLDVLVLYTFILSGISVYVATAVGFLVGAVNGYILNSAFVFRTDRSLRRFSKYLFSSFIGLLLTELIVDVVHVRFSLRLSIAKLLAVGVVFFWNYTLSKYWAFR